MDINTNMSAFSKTLNYSDVKRKAMGSRVTKVCVAPQNGSTFTAGQNIQIRLPTMAGAYMALDQGYLKFDVTAVGEAAALDQTAYSLFNRIDTQSQSATIDSLTQANCYYSFLMDVNCNGQSMKDWGAICLGSAGDPDQTHLGAELSTSAAKSFCLPFFHGIFNSTKMIPLDTSDGLNFSFYLESAANALIAKDAAAVPTGYEIKNVEWCAYVTQLSPESQALLDASLGDLGMNITFDAVAHTSGQKAGGDLNVVNSLGFRYSALSRVAILHRNQGNQGDALEHSISNRSHANLSEASLVVGGQSVPERPIKCGGERGFCEPLTETLISYGVLGSQDHSCGFNGMVRSTASAAGVLKNRYEIMDGTLGSAKDQDDAAKLSANIGSFGFSIDTDLIKSPTDGGIYSGLSTLGSTTQSRMVYSAAITPAMTIDYYATYTAILSLNSISRSWEVSV